MAGTLNCPLEPIEEHLQHGREIGTLEDIGPVEKGTKVIANS